MKIINTMYLWSQCSIAKLCLTVCEPMDRSTPGCPVFHYLLEFCSNSCPSSQWCHPTISSSVAPPFPPALNVSQHQGFSSESALHIRWPKFWSFSISPSNEYSGLISFRINLFDLIAVQGTLKSLFSTTVLKHQFLALSLLDGPSLTNVHDYWSLVWFLVFPFVRLTISSQSGSP